MIKTYHDRAAREKQVKDMLERGMSTSEIAKALGLRRQAVHAFLALRDWLPKAQAGQR